MLGSNKNRITISLDKDIIDTIDMLAKTSRRTRSQVISDAVCVLVLKIADNKLEQAAKDKSQEEEGHNA
jgi:metal-responsive CopG/Arc/MetJ family transcriptional regulator